MTSTDVEGGAALVFVTRSGDVAELRERVRAMVELHQHRAARPDGTDARAGAEPDEQRLGMMRRARMPASAAVAQDVDRGAMLILRPTDPAQLDTLRKHVRMHADRMEDGHCPAMLSPGSAEQPPHG